MDHFVTAKVGWLYESLALGLEHKDVTSRDEYKEEVIRFSHGKPDRLYSLSHALFRQTFWHINFFPFFSVVGVPKNDGIVDRGCRHVVVICDVNTNDISCVCGVDFLLTNDLSCSLILKRSL